MYNFVTGFRWAYKWRGLLKEHFKMSNSSVDWNTFLRFMVILPMPRFAYRSSPTLSSFAYRKSSKYDHVSFHRKHEYLTFRVFLVKYLGEKHKMSWTTTRLRDNQPVASNTWVWQLVLIKPLDFWFWWGNKDLFKNLMVWWAQVVELQCCCHRLVVTKFCCSLRRFMFFS